jgi:hypothetical protein
MATYTLMWIPAAVGSLPATCFAALGVPFDGKADQVAQTRRKQATFSRLHDLALALIQIPNEIDRDFLL